MLGTITTVAAIALAHAAVRPPASKEDGWKLSSPPSLHYLADRASTDQPIFTDGAYTLSTLSPEYARTAQTHDRLELLQAELLSYKSLLAGWDGDGSNPADGAHIEAASQILKLLPAGIPMPKPMLSADGEVGLYWKSSEYLADAVIEDASHFSLFIRSLKDGNPEVFIPSIAIGLDTPAAIAAAFQAA